MQVFVHHQGAVIIHKYGLKPQVFFIVEYCKGGQITCEQACGVFKCSELWCRLHLRLTRLMLILKTKKYLVNYSKLVCLKGVVKRVALIAKQIKQILRDSIRIELNQHMKALLIWNRFYMIMKNVLIH